MPVYNYVRAQCADGEVPADDAPAFVVEAVERWLSQQSLAGSAAITVGEVSDPQLALLVLHGEGAPGDTDFVHVVAVPDRRLADAAPKGLRRLFESLYGGRLERALANLRSELAGLPFASLAPRVLRHFAADADVESLHWSRAGEARPPTPASSPVSPHAAGLSPRWLLPGAVAAGALALLFGVLAGAKLAANLENRAATDEALRAKLAALEQRVEGLANALAEAAVDLRWVVARTEQRVAESDWRSDAGADALAAESEWLQSPSEPAPNLANLEPAPRFEPEPEPEPEPAEPVLALPNVAASPPAPYQFEYRVVVDTARVRSEPSGEGETRGLLARGTRLVALAHMDDWIEIEPPEGLSAPSWVHASLLEERP